MVSTDIFVAVRPDAKQLPSISSICIGCPKFAEQTRSAVFFSAVTNILCELFLESLVHFFIGSSVQNYFPLKGISATSRQAL